MQSLTLQAINSGAQEAPNVLPLPGAKSLTALAIKGEQHGCNQVPGLSSTPDIPEWSIMVFFKLKSRFQVKCYHITVLPFLRDY